MSRFKALPGGRRVVLGGASPAAIFQAAAEAFTERLVPLATVEPRRAEELDVEAPDLEVLLVDFVTELLYRFDTRGWLTRSAEVELREQDDGWALLSTVWGESLDPARHRRRESDVDEASCERFRARGGRWGAVLAFHGDAPATRREGGDE
ncbi:MAG: archease [Vicinamibacterales bacterium]